MLEIQTKHVDPDIVVLEIAGRITLGRECKQLEWAVESLVSEGRKKVIFDLAGVNFVDSTGIGIIVMSAGKMKKAAGDLRLAGATAHVEEVLKMTSVDQIVGLHPTAGQRRQASEVHTDSATHPWPAYPQDGLRPSHGQTDTDTATISHRRRSKLPKILIISE
jgi:anti-sigma B factor antagonist